MFEEFYEDFFTSNGSEGMDETMQFIMRKVTGEMNRELLREVTTKEVKIAVFGMGAIKLPEPQTIYWRLFPSTATK